MTTEFFPSLPVFIHGAVPVAACTFTVFLPETLGQPLPNSGPGEKGGSTLLCPPHPQGYIRSSQLLNPVPSEKKSQTQGRAETYPRSFSRTLAKPRPLESPGSCSHRKAVEFLLGLSALENNRNFGHKLGQLSTDT